MKHLFIAPQGTFLVAASLLAGGVAVAQSAPPSPAQSATAPQIVVSGATVSVPVAAGAAKVRLRLRNGAAYLDEETARNSGNRVSARLDAEPGQYVLRPFATDKNAGLVGPPLSIVVPGVRREAGVWLFNGSMWIEKTTPLAGARPTFFENLNRSGKAKLPTSVPTAQLAGWQTLPLDIAGADVATIPAGTGGSFVGYSTIARGEMDGAAATLRNFGKSRTLILQVDAAANPLLAARQLENAAREADAVVLKFDGAKPLVPQLWPLKMARRMAEETDNFDLPIFADVSADGANASRLTDAQLLEIYCNGATGFLTDAGTPEPNWMRVWDANSNWLAGAVTLEDMGVINTDSPRLEPLLADLRAGGRIPLAGQLPTAKNEKGESNMMLLDDSTSAAMLDGVKKAATAGNTVYLEGLPAPALYGKMGEITGLEVKPLAAPRDDVMTLDDPWTWGAINGREFAVRQRVSLSVKQSLAAQTKEQKGLDIETTPRAAAKLTGDVLGWMSCPVGKGRIFWMPQSFGASANRPDFTEYYAAVAGAMQSSLLELSGDRANVRVALRATPGQSALLGLFNAGTTATKLNVGVRGDATYVLDLMNDKTIDNQVVGFETRFDVEVPAGGYRWLALAATQQILDKERELKRVKARLK